MNKMKINISILLMICLIFAVVLYFVNRQKDVNAFIAVGCSAINYSQQQDFGYIELKIDAMGGKTRVLKVEDKELQKKMQTIDLSKIYAANLTMTIPKKELEMNHVDDKNLNSFDLLIGTEQYDKYILVVNVFFD